MCVDSAAAEYVSFDVGSAAGCASAGCNFEHHVVQCGGCCGCASAVFSLREVETDQSEAVSQSEVQQQMVIGRLAAIEKGLADMTAMNKSFLDGKQASASHIRQYSSEAEMTLERNIDKVVKVRAEEHSLSSESAARACLIDGRKAEVPRGKRPCLGGHSTDIRQLKCPWPGCHAPCEGTIEQQLVQPVCMNCTKPLIHSQEDPTVRLQLMKDVAEMKEKDGKYNKVPKGPLGGILPKDQHVTESKDKLWRLLRLANDPDNFVILCQQSILNNKVSEMLGPTAKWLFTLYTPGLLF